MLISSLPALPVHFEDAERVPISRLRLNQRLTMLDEEAAEALERMADFLVWDRQPFDRTDLDVCRHYDQFMESFQNPLARRWVDYAMTVRTIVSALRRRRLGLDAPPGVGWSAEHIARNWAHPDFRLAVRLPWIAEVDAQLNGDSPFELERTLLNLKWTHAKRLADQYQFSFEAVLLYLIRWEIVFYWTRRDAALGQEKFERLVANTMGKYATMFEP
jgi:hypothetical protein